MARKLIGKVNPNQQSQPSLKDNAGMAGSIAGGFAAPWPLSAATSAAGAMAGKRVEQGQAPIPTSPGMMLLTQLLDPAINKKLMQSEYSPEALSKDPATIKFGIEQGGLDLAGGIPGKILKGLGSLVQGPLKKIHLSTPKGIINQVEKLKSTIYPQVEEILAKNADSKIPIAPIFEKLFKLSSEYGPEAKNVPQAQKKVSDVAMRLLGGGDEATPMGAEMLRKGFGEDIFGESGKELTKRGGAGIAEKKAKEMSGGALKEELDKLPGYKPLMDEYGQLAQVGKEMEHPLNPKLSIGSLFLLMSALTGGYGLGGIPGSATGLGLFGASQVPYLKLLGQKGIGTALDLAGEASSPLAKLLGDYMINQKNTQ